MDIVTLTLIEGGKLSFNRADYFYHMEGEADDGSKVRSLGIVRNGVLNTFIMKDTFAQITKAVVK